MAEYGHPEEVFDVEIFVPKAVGKKSSMTSPKLLRSEKIGEPTGGVGKDRLAKRCVKNLKNEIQIKNGYAEMNMVLMQTIERKEPMSKSAAHPLVMALANITPPVCPVTKLATTRIERHIERKPTGLVNVKARKSNLVSRYDSARHKPEYRDPVVTIDGLSNKEVKRRTQFKSLNDLLSFIFLVCNGDVLLMEKTSTTMTWFEECFFFEMMWGRTIVRWADSSSYNHYGIHTKALREVFDRITELILKARRSFPKYASFEEDNKFRKLYWNLRYRGMRIVMWDNTNIDCDKFGNSDIQAATFSSYYNSNCAKGGVFVQTCGWMGVHSLWSGSVSDSEYMTKTDILKEQMRFALDDMVNGMVIAFTNVMDKGYRITMDCQEAGNQKTLQPDFMRCDKIFRAVESLSSATVASDRSGNE